MSKISRKTKSTQGTATPRLEEVVEDLEAIERMQRILKKELARTTKLLKELDADPTSDRTKSLLGPVAELNAVTISLLNTLNDSKWASIVLRAELNRGEHGPTFDAPNKLRKYLAAN